MIGNINKKLLVRSEFLILTEEEAEYCIGREAKILSLSATNVEGSFKICGRQKVRQTNEFD